MVEMLSSWIPDQEVATLPFFKLKPTSKDGEVKLLSEITLAQIYNFSCARHFTKLRHDILQ